MSSPGVIAKQHSGAYRRWAPTALDAVPVKPPLAPNLPTVEQIERIQQQAREEGRAAGLLEGRQQAAAEAQRLHALADELQKELDRVDDTVGQEVLALSLDIAKQVLCGALRARPDLILPVVQEALRCLPQFNQPAHILLHPDDAGLVRAHLGDRLVYAEWKVVEDAQILRGGCRIETATGQVDATLASRWQHVIAALGQTSEWLE